MKRLLYLLLLIGSYTTSGQTYPGQLVNDYWFSGSLSLGQQERNKIADASAWLQIGKDTTNKGLLLPRGFVSSLTTTKRGLFMFDLTDSVLYHLDGAQKVRYMTYKDTAVMKLLKIPAANIIADATHRFVTDAQVSTWNGKQDALGFTPENVANKSTSTSLGTSNTLYPTQGAVKAYVDAGLLPKLTDGGDTKGANIIAGTNDGNNFILRTKGINRWVIDTAGKGTLNITSGERFLTFQSPLTTTSANIGLGGPGSTDAAANYAYWMAFVGALRGGIAFNPATEILFTVGLRQYQLGTVGGVVIRSAWNANINNYFDLTSSTTTHNLSAQNISYLRVGAGNSYIPTSAQSLTVLNLSGWAVNHARTDAPSTFLLIDPTITSNASALRGVDVNISNASAVQFYARGTAPSIFNGPLIAGTTTNNGNALQVTGNFSLTGNLLQGAIGRYVGTGTPEGVVTANPGSTYNRTDVGSMYIKGSGTGNTNWKLITQAP